MNGIANFVAFADSDQVAEVVGDDSQVVSMIVDVGGEEGAVPPAEDHLFAPAWRLPINLDVELIGLDQPGRLRQSLADLSQEEDEAVRPGTVAPQSGVSLEGQPPVDCSTHQPQRIRCVPGLGGEEVRGER